MMASMLSRVATEFVLARGRQFSGNELADFMRRELRDEKVTGFRPEIYFVNGSANAGIGHLDAWKNPLL
jgi:hypothetical protein